MLLRAISQRNSPFVGDNLRRSGFPEDQSPWPRIMAEKGVRMDNEQSVDTGLQNQVPVEQPVQTQSESVTTESPKQAPVEKMFTQSQVQAIAAKEKRVAEERAEARIRSEYESRMTQSATQQPQTQSIGGIQQTSPEEIQRMIRQEAFNMSREHRAKEIEQNWYSAMDAEKIADPEFADLYDAIGIEQQTGLVIAMAGMENKAQVVKDLAKNPSKYANILTLANGGSPKLAQMELNKLSASIKANQDAIKQPKVDAPLSQIRASNIGGDDGNMSTTDFRAQSWLRG